MDFCSAIIFIQKCGYVDIQYQKTQGIPPFPQKQ